MRHGYGKKTFHNPTERINNRQKQKVGVEQDSRKGSIKLSKVYNTCRSQSCIHCRQLSFIAVTQSSTLFLLWSSHPLQSFQLVDNIFTSATSQPHHSHHQEVHIHLAGTIFLIVSKVLLVVEKSSVTGQGREKGSPRKRAKKKL